MLKGRGFWITLLFVTYFGFFVPFYLVRVKKICCSIYDSSLIPGQVESDFMDNLFG
ncbi:hypothetical protein NIES4075_34260 [Tolypothrix sp. NIES-4075]|nr:hypothetical protein NIES4075_34260 [Tolypothrix sp. NIES-4075]